MFVMSVVAMQIAILGVEKNRIKKFDFFSCISIGYILRLWPWTIWFRGKPRQKPRITIIMIFLFTMIYIKFDATINIKK